MLRRSQIRCIALLGVSLFCAAACSEPSAPTPARILSPSELTPQERKYGRAPKKDRSVVYQKDVIIPEGGADIIRESGADGISWTIDANAKHVGEISVGKIIFITGRCVGRVLHLERTGPDLKMILGPVELTDIFEKLNLVVSNQPIDLSNALQYPPPQPAGTFDVIEVPQDVDEWSANRVPRTLKPTALRKGPERELVSALFVADKTVSKALSDANGIGMELRGGVKGLRAVAQAQLRIAKPTLDASISIDHGSVEASVLFHNAAGLRIAFDAAVNEEFPGRLRWYTPAGQVSFPISAAVPFSIDIRQDLFLDAVFAARASSFSGTGEYEFNADIGFKLQQGKFELVGPQGITVKHDFMSSYGGVSIAPRELALRHGVTFTAGLGGAGFTIGPQAILGTRIDAVKGSDVAIADCRGASLQMGVKGGVGWTLNRTVVNVINSILNIIHLAPIPDHKGVFSNWKYFINKKAQTPTQICGGAQS